MLCSSCNKNVAVIFINKVENGKSSLEGLCYNCAKEKGINPLEVLAKQSNLSEENLEDMSKQFEDIFNDISENIDMQEISAENPDQAGSFQLGTILSSMLGPNSQNHSENSKSNENSDNKKKVKTEKVPKAKKRNFLDTYGTNLTEKARASKLDAVIGRDKEIQRIIQILNRRSKNNPCLIGEPGVGKTAIAQGLSIKIANQKVPPKLLKI